MAPIVNHAIDKLGFIGCRLLAVSNLDRGGYFFMVNLLERQRTLLTDHIDLLRDSVRRVKVMYPFHIDAWVVLPDHMHTIWMLPPDTDDFPVRWRLIKLLFSKGLPRPNASHPSAANAPNAASGSAAIGTIPARPIAIMRNILIMFMPIR
jgi:hypothetical protein